MQVNSNVGTNSFRQKGVDLIIERERNFLKELEFSSSELEPLPTMVDEKKDLVGASDEKNNISGIAITELLSNALSRGSPDGDKGDKEIKSKTDKSSTLTKENFTNIQKKSCILTNRSMLKMKISGSTFYFENKQTTKVSCTSCSEKDKKIDRLEVKILKMEAEIGRLSSVIGNVEYIGKFYIVSNFS